MHIVHTKRKNLYFNTIFLVCRLEEEPNCNIQDQCSPYAECIQDGQDYHCQCLPGYTGNLVLVTFEFTIFCNFNPNLTLEIIFN